MPVPFIATNGWLLALLSIESLPDLAPVTVGLNITPIAQLCPGLSVVSDAQVVRPANTAKSPVKFQLSSVTAIALFFLGFESTTVRNLLLRPIAIFPNLSLSGVNLSGDATGVWIDVGVLLIVGVAVAVCVAVRVAVAVGLDLAVKVADALAVAVLVDVLVAVTVAVDVRVAVPVTIAVLDAVAVAVAVDVAVLVAVAVRVGVLVDVPVADAVGVAVLVAVAVALVVGVGLAPLANALANSAMSTLPNPVT